MLYVQHKGLKDGLRLNVPQQFCGFEKWILLFLCFVTLNVVIISPFLDM